MLITVDRSILITVFIVFEVVVSRQPPKFIVHPVSINTTDGTTVEFNCTVDNYPKILQFLVNGTDVSSDDVEKGFMQLPPENLGGGIRRRRLLVTASVAKNSNSRIQCRAFNGSITIAIQIWSSSIAILLVQGPLSSVVDLSYSFIASSNVSISWSPPFTLPGTDITGYNISAASNGTSTINYFTPDSHYVLLLTDITDSPCNKIIITVSGYNGLDGESHSTLVPSVEPIVPLMMTEVLTNLSVLVSITGNGTCVGSYSAVNVSLLRGNELIGSILETLDSATKTLYSDIFQLKEDQNYTMIGFYSIFGTKVIMNEMTFDTYGVESVTIPQVVDGIVTIICQFNSFSTDTGCTVQLVLRDTGTVLYTVTFNKTGSIAEGSISIMSGGVYDILAFDEGSTVVAASLLGVNVTGPTITTTTSTSTTSTSTSTANKIRTTDQPISTTITNTPIITITTLTTLLMSMSNTASPSMLSKPGGDSALVTGVSVSAVVGLVLIILIMIVIASGFAIFRKKKPTKTIEATEVTSGGQTENQEE